MKKLKYLRDEGQTKIFGFKNQLFSAKKERYTEIRVDAYDEGTVILLAKVTSLGQVKEWANIALECLKKESDFNEVLNKAYNKPRMQLTEIIIDFGNDILVSVMANHPKNVEEIYDEYWNFLMMLKREDDD